MNGTIWLILPVLFPVIAGIFILTRKGFAQNRKKWTGFVFFVLVLEILLGLVSFRQAGESLTLWQLTRQTAVAFGWMESAGCLQD